MSLKKKIYVNLRSQMLLAIKADQLQSQLKSLDSERERLTGAISILGELFKEDTGSDLQNSINTDPEWGDLVKEAQKEAQQIASGGNPSGNIQIPECESNPQEVKNPSMPKLRSNTGNRTVQEAAADVAVLEPEEAIATTEQMPQLKPSRGRPPVTVVIDDNPPGPSTPDKPDPS